MHSGIPHADYIANQIEEYNPDEITIFAAEEFEIQNHWENGAGYSKLEEYAKSNPLNIIVGAFDSPLRDQTVQMPKGSNVYFWPTFWSSRTAYEIMRYDGASIKEPNMYPEKLFMSLNNQPYEHRCLMMDIMAEMNLIDFGDLTWHYPDVDYDWKHWSPKKLTLDQKYAENPDMFVTAPDGFKTTFCSLIAESTMRAHFITEKTWIQIFSKRPFLIFGPPGIHKYLTSLGIQNYDEVFDYSFDSIIDPDDRCRALLANLQRIQTRNENHKYLSNLRQKINQKIDDNLRVATDLAFNDSYVPKIVQEHLSNCTEFDPLSWYLSLPIEGEFNDKFQEQAYLRELCCDQRNQFENMSSSNYIVFEAIQDQIITYSYRNDLSSKDWTHIINKHQTRCDTVIYGFMQLREIGHYPDYYMTMMEEWIKILKDNNVTDDQILLCTNIHTLLDDTSDNFNNGKIRFNNEILYLRFFEDDCVYRHNIYNSTAQELQDVYQYTKKYLALFGKPHKYFRAGALLHMTRNGMLDESTYSCLTGPDIDTVSDLASEFWPRDEIKEILQNSYSPDDVEYDHDKDTPSVTHYRGYPYNVDLYKDSFISIIAETNDVQYNDSIPAQHQFFITEKTTRAIQNFHPFIILSTVGFLANLRKLGYKTFNKFCDESYDTIEDPYQRLEHALKAAEQLAECSDPELLNILQHNFTLMQNTYEADMLLIRKTIIDKANRLTINKS